MAQDSSGIAANAGIFNRYPVTAKKPTQPKLQPMSSGRSTSSSGGDAYSALMKKYEETAKPSKEETATQKQIDTYEKQKAESIASAVGRPVMQGFVTGQQAAIENRYAGLETPLTTKLATLMQQRGATSDVLSKEMSMLQQQQQAAQAQANADRTAAMEEQRIGISGAGDWIVKYDKSGNPVSRYNNKTGETQQLGGSTGSTGQSNSLSGY